VFPLWVGGGPGLDLKVPFPQQVGSQGPFFSFASCLGWLGLSFEPPTAFIGVKLVSGAHIAFFLSGQMGLGVVLALQNPRLQATHLK